MIANRIFAILFFIASMAYADAKVCKVCRMDADNKGAFEIKTKDSIIPFCSLSCAKRYYKKKPTGDMSVKDFSDGKMLDANKAFFVYGCDKLAEEIPNSMPPVVAAFADQSKAQEFVSKLQCGKIGQGIKSIK